MHYRQLTLRFMGLCVAGVVLVAAVQMLTLSIDSDPVLDHDSIGDVTRWLRHQHSAGAEVLVGVALVLFGAWLAWTLLSSLRTDRKVLTTRRGDGWTKIDRRSLADSLERSLADVDPSATLSVNVRRNRRVDVTMATPSPHPDERLEDLRAALEHVISQRSLPCRPGRVAAKTPRRNTRRRVQ